MKIKTRRDPPAIPIRDFDWSAWDEDTYDGAEDSATRYQIGWGRTEDAAVADLKQQLEDCHD